MKVRIDIDTRTFVRFWLVVIGFAFAILMVYNARTALFLLGLAFFLALALNAPVSYLAGHLPGKSRVGGTAIAYVLVVISWQRSFLVVPPSLQQRKVSSDRSWTLLKARPAVTIEMTGDKIHSESGGQRPSDDSK